MKEPEFLTIRDFCSRYGIGRTKAYELLHAGTIEGVKCGARTLIRAASVRRWISTFPDFKDAALPAVSRRARA